MKPQLGRGWAQFLAKDAALLVKTRTCATKLKFPAF
jgi:hypothetical protein